MLVLRDPADATKVADAEIRALVIERFAMVNENDDYDPDLYGYFIVLEDGDTLAELDEQLGFSVLVNRIDGLRYGQPHYVPSFEFVEEFTGGCGCYDMVFVLNDDGFGVEIFIPKTARLDRDLLALCAEFATPTNTDEPAL